ncbi:hypothetical protein Nos7524_3163 [Nostoc sp. PCC 7524]|uniref:hypothetical protein n=1 Tax=Nostoc sp. (strain ATCC 29411 / PCC 7524) TaxID=28072 RepID=UPI00029F49AD|nr:hypothetical protein [Nostoc sp. PCC 7524]AFY48966.1 hypothetical protein Nos7524_3163 [Nostoc sp. PCC 7524]
MDTNSNISDQNQVDSPQILLPRSAWNSQIAYLRLLFKAKKALDRIEEAAGLQKI